MALQNILITGAAGFIGGSIVADLMNGLVTSVKHCNVFAAVRSEEQAAALSSSGVNVIRLDLSDEEAVIKSIIDYGISIVIHTASSILPGLALNLINGLSKQRKDSGEQTYYIHTSGMSAFMPATGWPSGKLRGAANDIFETERELADSYPLRKTDVTVIERAQAEGVASFIVVPCVTHGKGTGAWNQLSVVIPIAVKASLERKEVRRFAENTNTSHVHVSDLTALYGQIIGKILQGEDLPNGRNGYYFSTAYQISSYEFTDRLVAALHARGLVSSPEPKVWESPEAAADALGVPVQFVELLWSFGDDAPATGIGSEDKVGWKPKWDKKRFLDNIDEEIDAVLELGQAKSSLVDSLFAAAKE